jgi:hypothetical protein
LIKLKLGLGSYGRFLAAMRVRRGDLLGLSPYFDDQVVLSPIDGVVERIDVDPEGQAVLISIRRLRLTGGSSFARRNER